MSESPPPSAARNRLILLATGAALLIAMWLASQGGLRATSGGKFAASILVILEALPALAAVWLGAAGIGYALRRALLPHVRFPVVVQLGLGIAGMMLVNWLLAWAGWLNGVTAWGLCGLGAALLVVQLIQHRDHLAAATAHVRLPGPLPLAMLGLGVMLIAATCPPGTLWRVEAFGYDVLSYHLQLPREWLELGAMRGLEHNVYSYLPSLVEASYLQLAAMHGSVYDAIYTCQLFHVSLAMLAALATGCAAAIFAPPAAATVAGALVLVLPWSIITGSMAYNEMAVLALFAVALIVLFDVASERPRGAVAIGLLVGAATLAKLTAGFFVAVPVGVVMLSRLNHALRWRKPPRWTVAWRAAAITALAGAATLSPYLVRNATWTGNPVFPFATDLLGRGHWSEPLSERWDQGHGLAWHDADLADALARQWLFNTGYGALGGRPTPRETQNIARFDTEGGLPLVWTAVLVSAALGLWPRGRRRAVAALVMVLALQVGFWMIATHLQSRFLLPTIVPAAVLVGIGLGRLREITEGRLRWLAPAGGAALILTLAAVSLGVLFHQTQAVWNTEGQRVHATPATLADSLADPERGRPGLVGQHAINRLPRTSRTYLVADAATLLYIRRPMIYHTAFDASPLGAMLREADGDVQAVNRMLRAAGVTHVWVHWSELDRLHSTYGYDPAVTRESLDALIATGWRTADRFGDIATLYALPRATD